MKNKSPIKLKDGTVFPVGSDCSVRFEQFRKDEREVTIAVVTVAGREFKTRPIHLTVWFDTFKAPSTATMGKWVDSGIAKTMTGDRTEPDGYGPDGAPSWLLALGLI